MKKKTFFKNPHNNRNRATSHYKKPLYMQHSSKPKKSGPVELTIEQQVNVCGAVLAKQLSNYVAQQIIKNVNAQKAINKWFIETRPLGIGCLMFFGCPVSMVVAHCIADNLKSITDKEHMNIVGATGLIFVFACVILWAVKDTIDKINIRKCDKEIAKMQEDISKNNADIKRLQQMLNVQHVR